MKKKTLLILGASTLQLPAIKVAKRMGVRVIVADMNPNAVGFKEADVIGEYVSTTDTAGILAIAEKHRIDGIMTLASDVPIPTIAIVCDKLGLSGISLQAALSATNKAEMRHCLHTAHVPVPGYFVARTWDEFLAFSGNFSTRFVVKASDNSGNRGICSVKDSSNRNDVENAWNYARQNTRDGRVLLEEYMDGDEFSVEGFCVGGEYRVIQVTDKMTTGEPYFVEMGHTQPSSYPDDFLEGIKQVAKRGVIALGIKEGPSHTEIKWTSGGPKIVEIGARLGGGFITTHLVPLSTGVNMVEATIKTALGEIPDLTQKFYKGSAVRFLISKPGFFTGIEGVSVAQTIPGVVEIGSLKNPGEYIPQLKTGLDRVGYVISQGESSSDAVRVCQEAVEKLKVVTRCTKDF